MWKYYENIVVAFLNFNFLFFILFFPYLFFFSSTRFFSFLFIPLFFSSTPFPYLYLHFSFFFCSLALRLSSLHFTFFLFFSSSTPLELSSLFFFLFSFLLFVYSRAFKKLSLSFSLSHKQILSLTHRSLAKKWRSAFYMFYFCSGLISFILLFKFH